MIRAALAALALCCCGPAFGQVAQFQAIVIASCGTVVGLPTGSPRTPYMDQNGVLCTTAGAGGGGGGGATGSVGPAGTNGTAAQSIQGINGGVPVPVSATSWPLPTGAATATNQSTANASLASIDGKMPTLVNGGQPVTVLNQAATGSTEQDVRATGTLNAASTASMIDIPVNGQSTVGLRFSGLAASGATVSYFQSNDGGTTFTPVSEVNTATGVTSLTRTTDGQVRVAVQGRTTMRLQVTTAGTGTISVAWNVSVREGLVSLASPIPPGANTIGSIANTAFGITGPLPAGTNVIGAVTQSGGPWSVSGTVAANLGTLNGAATDATVSAGNPKAYTLASNAAAAGAGTTVTGVKGADYIFSVQGTFGALTATLQTLGLDGTTWQTVTRADGTAVSCVAACALGVGIGQGTSVRVNLTGTPSGTPAIYSSIAGIN